MQQRCAHGSLSPQVLGGVLALLLSGAPGLSQTSYRAIDLNHGEPYGSAVLALDAGRASGFVIESYGNIQQGQYCRHAAYWTSVTAAPLKLKLSDSLCSDLRGMSGARQVGAAARFSNANHYLHAILLDSVGEKPRDLSTARFEDSAANGIHGDEVVGQASGPATSAHVHAVLWRIRTDTAVDLNGTNHLESVALATDGTRQAGWASDKHGESAHAMLWFGTRHVETDLNPEGFDSSYAYAIDAGSQVGVGLTRNSAHALLWHGHAAGVVDLNPVGFVESYATGVSRARQVGYAIGADLNAHALVWSSNASSYIDLQKFLPTGLTQSYATSIDAAGEIGGYATEANGTAHAIMWRPVRAKASPVTRVATTGD